MDVGAALLELYGRIPPLVGRAVEGLQPGQLTAAPGNDSNPIGWLVWHLTRVQDHHIAELLHEDQVWVSGAWAQRFGLDADPTNTGYNHSARDVAAVKPESAGALVEYHETVDHRTRRMIERLGPDDLDRIVDERWDPPVTLGVRLVSVADDSLQHVGQAAYIRGLLGF